MQEITLYPLHRNIHILFSDKHNMSFSQIYTVHLFSSQTDTVSSFQIYKLYCLHRNTPIFFLEKHTLFSSHKYILYPLHRITQYNLFSKKHIISSLSLYPVLTNTHYPLFRFRQYIHFTEILIIHPIQKSTSHINSLYPLLR